MTAKLKVTKTLQSSDRRLTQADSNPTETDHCLARISASCDRIDDRFNKMDLEFAYIRAQFAEVLSTLADLRMKISRILNLLETNESQDRVIFDRFEQLLGRQDRFEHQVNQRVQAVEEVIAAIPKIAPDPT